MSGEEGEVKVRMSVSIIQNIMGRDRGPYLSKDNDGRNVIHSSGMLCNVCF